jgi:hypothetical protein
MLKGGMGLLQLFAEGAAAMPCCCLLTGKEMSEIILCDLYPNFCRKSKKFREIIFCGLYPSLARNCNCGLKGQFDILHDVFVNCNLVNIR